MWSVPVSYTGAEMFRFMIQFNQIEKYLSLKAALLCLGLPQVEDAAAVSDGNTQSGILIF